jgi:hypothetical protein
MTVRALVVIAVLQLAFASRASCSGAPLQGCATPTSIASTLVGLRERGWTAWTPQEVAKAWPRTLESLDCQSSSGSCTLLSHQGRSRSGSCECCETFQFDSKAEGDGKAQEQLSAVTLYYSAERYPDAVSAARLLAKALGLPDTEGTIAKDQPPREPQKGHFEWKDTSVQRRAVLDVEISHGRVWMAYLRLGWR